MTQSHSAVHYEPYRVHAVLAIARAVSELAAVPVNAVTVACKNCVMATISVMSGHFHSCESLAGALENDLILKSMQLNARHCAVVSTECCIACSWLAATE